MMPPGICLVARPAGARTAPAKSPQRLPGAEVAHCRVALRSTVYKASLQLAHLDRALYADHALTLALHPSETEERLMIRLLAFALETPPDDERGALQFGRGISDTEEPDLWQRDLTGVIVHWLEVGQPDPRRLARACGRAERVSLYVYAAASPIWWAGVQADVARLGNLAVWRIEAAESKALAALAARAMQLQVTVQEGHVWFASGDRTVEITPIVLKAPNEARR